MNPTNPTPHTMSRKVFFKIFLGVASLFLLVETVSIVKSWSVAGIDPANPPSIVVSGEGKAFAVPSAAEFTFSVDETAPTVAAAQQLATTLSNKALDYLKSQKIPDTNIQTTNYSVNPHYTYTGTICPPNLACPSGKQTLDGYEVVQTIDVKIDDASTAGAILSAVGALGVQNISGLQFTVPDQTAVEAQARQLAIADAKTQAQTLASQLGVKLVRIISFQESNNQPGPIMYTANSLGKASPAMAIPEIPTGQNTFTSDITITYEIR